jgi:4-methyl-5(b-hydroxyethyl)-thiazole monophosphate biosynthesis
MAAAVVLLAEGFEELEAISIVDVLRRASVKVMLAGLAEGPVKSVHDVVIQSDGLIDDVDEAGFDAIVLPGGTPGAKRLREDARVLSMLRRFYEAGKWTCAVCAAPTALEAAGVLKGKRATSYPGNALPSAIYVEERVVVDGNLITSRGPGTAADFALTIAEKLAGPDAAAQTRKAMLLAS